MLLFAVLQTPVEAVDGLAKAPKRADDETGPPGGFFEAPVDSMAAPRAAKLGNSASWLIVGAAPEPIKSRQVVVVVVVVVLVTIGAAAGVVCSATRGIAVVSATLVSVDLADD